MPLRQATSQTFRCIPITIGIFRRASSLWAFHLNPSHKFVVGKRVEFSTFDVHRFKNVQNRILYYMTELFHNP